MSVRGSLCGNTQWGGKSAFLAFDSRGSKSQNLVIKHLEIINPHKIIMRLPSPAPTLAHTASKRKKTQTRQTNPIMRYYLTQQQAVVSQIVVGAAGGL